MPETEDPLGKGDVPCSLRVANFCRLSVRIWSLAVTATIGWQAFILWNGARPPGADLFRMDVLPLLAVYCLGLIVAWLSEFLGGVISLAAVLFLFEAAGKFLPALFLPCLAVPAILALASSFIRNRRVIPAAFVSLVTPFRWTDAIPMIVVLLVAAAIAIPSLLRTNFEPGSSCIASLKMLVTAEEGYKSAHGRYAALTQLSATTPQYLDSVLGGGKKSGYCFILTVGMPADSKWCARADPVVPRKHGNRYLFVDSTGTIRFKIGAPATSADSPIE